MKKLKNIHFKLKYYNFRLIFFIISLTLLGIIVIGSAAPGQNYQMKQFRNFAGEKLPAIKFRSISSLLTVSR